MTGIDYKEIAQEALATALDSAGFADDISRPSNLEAARSWARAQVIERTTNPFELRRNLNEMDMVLQNHSRRVLQGGKLGEYVRTQVERGEAYRNN